MFLFLALQAYNESECGYLYSTAEQVGFCPMREPPLWPALVQVRGGRWHPVGARVMAVGALLLPRAAGCCRAGCRG